ncbi:MAG: hypothetical protein U0798_19900, partial [Gemmataceae bacterium]
MTRCSEIIRSVRLLSVVTTFTLSAVIVNGQETILQPVPLSAVSPIPVAPVAQNLQPAPSQPLPVPNPATNGNVKKLSVQECIAIAEANHPSIKMAESSLSQTMKGSASLQKVPPFIGGLFRPDLPIRKQQSCRGVDAAVANCALARQLVVNDVCRMYYTYIYASQQEGVVNEIVAQLKLFEDLVREY